MLNESLFDCPRGLDRQLMRQDLSHSLRAGHWLALVGNPRIELGELVGGNANRDRRCIHRRPPPP